jgi:hypothetical protein
LEHMKAKHNERLSKLIAGEEWQEPELTDQEREEELLAFIDEARNEISTENTLKFVRDLKQTVIEYEEEEELKNFIYGILFFIFLVILLGILFGLTQ